MYSPLVISQCPQNKIRFLEKAQMASAVWHMPRFSLIFDHIQWCNPEKAMAPHSSTLAWKIPWTEEPGGLQSVGSRRIGHDWVTSFSLFTFMHWRRKWQPTPVFWPGESQGWGSLVGCRLWGRTRLKRLSSSSSGATRLSSMELPEHAWLLCSSGPLITVFFTGLGPISSWALPGNPFSSFKTEI